jgi:thiol-disulfide isomerase/thioredoxin
VNQEDFMLRSTTRLASLALAAILASTLGGAAAAAEELAIGAKAPDFTLLGTDGQKYTLSAIAAPEKGAAPKAVAVVFTCNHCPFSQAYEPLLIELAKKYSARGVAFVLVNPNDAKVQPEDSYDRMVSRAKDKGYPFPYLHDAGQDVAHAYGARVTPHIFLLDADLVVRYRGRINDNRDPEKVTAHDLVAAMDALLAGKAIETSETRAFGCTIKWKKAS